VRALLKFETHKLFYNQYLYKLVFVNSLANIFREKKLTFARDVLDELQHQFEKGNPLIRSTGYRQYPVESFEFLQCQSLYKELKTTNLDYKIRIEVPRIQLYANDRDWLEDVSYRCKTASEFWEPGSNYVEYLQENIILVNNPTRFQYKITLGDKRVDPGFNTWINKNADKIKIGKKCREAIQLGEYPANFYFYVRDERVLELIRLIIAPSIRRVDKLICKQDIDK
jgi:hypothetical protein